MTGFFSILGIIIILFVFYRIIMEVKDNYENQTQDDHILMLINDIRKIDKNVNDVVDNLRFFEGDKSYTLDKKYVFLCKKDKKTG